MTPFRVLQVSIVVFLLFGSTWVVRALGMASEPSGNTSTWLGSSPALAGVLQADNGDNNGGGGDNSDNGDSGGDNSDNNGNSNGNGNSNDNDDDFDFELPPPLPPYEPARPPEPECIQPGQEGTYTSHDEKVTVRVFSSTPQPVRIEIYQVIDFLAAPLPPGNLVGLLVYEIRGSLCDGKPLAQLPAEVNLGIRYNDIEATGLDESRFVIGHLDMATRTWRPVDKRANDPAANFTSATIIDTGFYMVWEAR